MTDNSADSAFASSPPSMTPTEILLNYVCPSLGVIMASLTFAAPVRDLKQALVKGSLGPLNPLPWVLMTGNCIGWVTYAYYTEDPFVLAANLPGLVGSIWLNMGAIKMQYYEVMMQVQVSHPDMVHNNNGSENDYNYDDDGDVDVDVSNESSLDNSNKHTHKHTHSHSHLMYSPHERKFIHMIAAWAVVLVAVGWVVPLNDPAEIVGLIANVNLIFFFGAPLQAIAQVIRSKSCNSIHKQTMIMNIANCFFWSAYGVARLDPLIATPNAISLLLGILQGLLCCVYPRRDNASNISDTSDSDTNGVTLHSHSGTNNRQIDMQSIQQNEAEEDSPPASIV